MKKLPFHKSFRTAFFGIFRMIRSERNFQLELFALIINLFLIVFLRLTPTDTALILIVCFAVLAVETINTAIEKICDMVQPDFDERIGFIKDISAGAVLLSVFGAVITGVLVYWKYVYFENGLFSVIEIVN